MPAIKKEKGIEKFLKLISDKTIKEVGMNTYAELYKIDKYKKVNRSVKNTEFTKRFDSWKSLNIHNLFKANILTLFYMRNKFIYCFIEPIKHLFG